MGMLEALPSVVRGGLVKAAKRCGAGVLADAAGAGAYPSQRCLFGNKRADSGEPASPGSALLGTFECHTSSKIIFSPHRNASSTAQAATRCLPWCRPVC